MPESGDLVGQILLGKIEVIRRLGGGGMGVVYEVEHRLTGHRRALKVVHQKFADRPRFMKRLLREAKVAGTLSTPYVVETYDAGRLEDGSAYVLMQLLEGDTLYEVMQDESRLAPRRIADIMTQLAEGMTVAHAAGIVHRDLKPENLFLVRDADGNERVKILDFGVSKFEESSGEPLARLTVEGTLVGTPYYMSPEQAGGRPVDARTDIYAMGVMMYETLTGRLPFEAESVGALFVKIGSGDCVPLRIRRPDLDPAWHDIVHRAFHRDPAERFQSAEALRRELVQLLGGGQTAARAKTISDGVRSTLGYSAELPRPPRAPSEAVAFLADADRDEDEADALAPPPAAAPARGRIPSWAWVAGGVIAVLLVLVPWQLARYEERRPSAPVAEPPRDPDPVLAAAPARGVEVPSAPRAEGGDAGLAASSAAASSDAASSDAASVASGEPLTPRPPRGTPAKAAGLDPNPYRR